MTFKNILFTVESGVARIVLNRPEKLNSLDAATMVEIHEAMSRIEADRQLRVLVLGGAGRAFCAGQDLADPAKLSKLLNRFSALYDIKNGQTAASSPVITLYQGGGLLSNTAFAAIAKGAR